MTRIEKNLFHVTIVLLGISVVMFISGISNMAKKAYQDSLPQVISNSEKTPAHDNAPASAANENKQTNQFSPKQEVMPIKEFRRRLNNVLQTRYDFSIAEFHSVPNIDSMMKNDISNEAGKSCLQVYQEYELLRDVSKASELLKEVKDILEKENLWHPTPAALPATPPASNQPEITPPRTEQTRAGRQDALRRKYQNEPWYQEATNNKANKSQQDQQQQNTPTPIIDVGAISLQELNAINNGYIPRRWLSIAKHPNMSFVGYTTDSNGKTYQRKYVVRDWIIKELQ